MGGVEGAGLAAEEALRQVASVPQVEVADLRALWAGDAKKMAGGHGEGASIARWYDRLGDLSHFAAGGLVKGRVERRQVFNRIVDDALGTAPLRGIGRRWRRCTLSPCHFHPSSTICSATRP